MKQTNRLIYKPKCQISKETKKLKFNGLEEK
ncbi:hypothetical protein VAA_00023 [Vibrio anguillarum 775]|nr:hypothetical protein VAA_00023 [Vibrio anguillarum 775]